MMMEADPTSEMCLNLKKRYKGDRRSQVHATSLTPSQTFMLSWLKLTCLQYCVRRWNINIFVQYFISFSVV